MSVSTYSDFQGLEASHKEGLVIMECARQLKGWTLYSGSVYRLTAPLPILSPNSPLADSGVALSAAASIAGITAGAYFYDRPNRTIYLQTSDSANPNGKFISCVFRLFFSKSGANLPNDLNSGFEVHWEPMLLSTGEFTFGLDNQYQLGNAIEGTGTVTLINDQDFWKPIFDKFYFDNQKVWVYSWSPLLPASEAKLLFQGIVNGKGYSFTQVTFKLADNFNALRSPIPLSNISDYHSARVPQNIFYAKQRKLYGYVNGHRPTNIDQILSGYPLPGTVSITGGGTALTGSGTNFLSSLTPGDVLIFGDDDNTLKVTVQDVTTNTAATITQAYGGTTKSGASFVILPQSPKTYLNRKFLIAGHALRQPSTTVASARATTFFTVVDATDIIAGDTILVAGESAVVERVSGNTIILANALTLIPVAGATVVRPPVSRVYLDGSLLIVNRDYTVDATSALLTLTSTAEFNIAPVVKMKGTVSFTNASQNVTGSGTSFSADLKPGYFIRASGFSDYFEVFKVTDDTNLVLRTASTYSATGQVGYVKSPDYYDEGNSVLSCDTLGATSDGTTAGVLLKTAPQIVKQILIDIGLSSMINSAAFTTAQGLTSTRLGLAIPATYSDQTTPVARDVINKINQSVFGALIQNEDFLLEYHILRPYKSTLTEFMESDALQMAINSNSDRLAKTVNLQYLFREADPVSSQASNQLQSATSNAAQYLAKTTKLFTVATALVDSLDALIFANRWSFILEVAAQIVTIDTKLQASRLKVGDILNIKHEKLYYRIGSTSARKLAAVQLVKKTIESVSIELEDLANAFSRCAVIAPDGSNAWSQASELDKATYGFITDDYGMQNNDPDTSGINVIW